MNPNLPVHQVSNTCNKQFILLQVHPMPVLKCLRAPMSIVHHGRGKSQSRSAMRKLSGPAEHLGSENTLNRCLLSDKKFCEAFVKILCWK